MTNKNLYTIVKESSASLKTKLKWNTLKAKPKVALVLGSGLGHFTENLTDKRVVPYKNVKHQPQSGVSGHAGQWVYGKTTQGHPVLVAQGRVHFYEGRSLFMITLAIRMMKELGLEHVILTNAAGSVNLNFKPGDLMLMDDHINLQFHSPLQGLGDSLGQRFVNLGNAYEKSINDAVIKICREKHPEISLLRGVYAADLGPQYETPAEIRMIGKLGADAIGMSTVPETIVAKQIGLKVNGISCITNFGCGLSETAPNHEEVKEIGKQTAPKFCVVLSEMIGVIYV